MILDTIMLIIYGVSYEKNFSGMIIVLSLMLTSLNVLAIEYSVNFMYINKGFTDEPYVFPVLREKQVRKQNWDIKTIDWLSAWLKGNSNGSFVFWYDQRTVTPEQIKQTEELFAELSKTYLNQGRLLLKDINSLVTVQRNQHYFAVTTPIYLRLDLLRIIVMLEELEPCAEECASIYADIDKGFELTDNGNMQALNLSAEGLFDSETVTGLKKYGLVMRSGLENSFLITSNQQPKMLEALRTIVIDSNFKRIDSLKLKESELRQNLLTEALKTAPLDHDFKEVNGFPDIDPECKDKLRALGQEYINSIYNTMIHGHLMVYFKYLEQKLDLTIKQPSMAGEKIDYADVFSKISTASYGDILRGEEQAAILEYTAVDFDDPQKAKEEGLRLIEDSPIPTKYIGGSSSASYNLRWK